MFDLKDLELGYGGRSLLGPLSMELAACGRSVLTGPSGCGKSTLLRVLAGLERPRAGRLSYQGDALDIGALVMHRRRVHLVGQHPLLVGSTLGRALTLGLELRGLPAPSDSCLREELAALGLGQLDLAASPAGLSGGERLRAALLRGLLLPVDLLLLDEASAALDEGSAEQVLTRLARPGTAPLICVSHDPRWLAFCDTRFEMRAGGLHAA